MFAGHNKGKYFMPGGGYVRGKKSDDVTKLRGGVYHKCPFCGCSNIAETFNTVCRKCERRWFQKKNGDFIYVGYSGDGK